MPSEKFEFRITFSRLLIGLLVTIIPISLAGLFSISQSDKALERAIGGQFRTIAESTASEVSQFVHDRLTSVAFLAAEPAVLDEIVAANRSYQGLTEAAIAARIKRIEDSWTTPAAQPVVDRILSSRASQVLRRFRQHDPRFLRITVTDAQGATVAGTHKSLDYFQADEDFWQNIHAQGRGAVSITDVRYDELTKSYYIGVGVPVMEEGSNRFLGVVDALVDISTLFPVVNRAHVGRSARTLLVKEDGTVIAGPHVNLAMGMKSEEYAAILDAVPTVFGRAAEALVSNLRRGERSVIGYADTGLKKDYGNLGWVVVVAQDAREAFAPVQTTGRLLAFMSLIGLAGVTLLAAYFAMHRHVPLTEIETLKHEYAK